MMVSSPDLKQRLLTSPRWQVQVKSQISLCGDLSVTRVQVVGLSPHLWYTASTNLSQKVKISKDTAVASTT